MIPLALLSLSSEGATRWTSSGVASSSPAKHDSSSGYSCVASSSSSPAKHRTPPPLSSDVSDIVDATIARIPINVKCMQAPPFGLDEGERRRGDEATPP